jgi:hypothetical protein
MKRHGLDVLNQNKDRWWVILIAVPNFQVPSIKSGEFLD